MIYALTPTPQQQVIQNSAAVSGALIHTYAAGSTTPIDTYSDSIGTLNSNPIVADTQGRWVCYLLTTLEYKFVVTDALGNPIYVQDHVRVTAPATPAPTTTSKTTNYSAVANDFVVAPSGTFTVTLPSAAANANASIWVTNNGSGVVTVARSGSDTIGLATSQTLKPAAAGAQGDALAFVSDGVSNWNLVSWNLVLRCSVYNSGLQSIPNNAQTALTFDTEDFDVGGFHSTSVNTSRMTIPAGCGGGYIVIANSSYAANASDVRLITIYKNGAAIRKGPSFVPNNAASTNTGVAVSALVQLVAGDYLEVFVYQATGGALNFGSAVYGDASQFQIVKVW